MALYKSIIIIIIKKKRNFVKTCIRYASWPRSGNKVKKVVGAAIVSLETEDRMIISLPCKLDNSRQER